MNVPPPPQEDDLPVRPGAVLAGKYQIEELIGQGGTGMVVAARPVGGGDRLAVKVLLPEHARRADVADAFLGDARAVMAIPGEHIVRVTGAGTLETGAPYMAMELLEGSDLADELERRGVCPIPDAVDYVLQACEAIAEAHSHGIVHGDLRPTNLFLTRRPDGSPLVKVLDFGISKTAASGEVEQVLASSAMYMSPEQITQVGGVDHRTDVYALGICLYELLAGKPPFQAATLSQLRAEILDGRATPIRILRADVPDDLAAVMERAYARAREARHQGIAAFAAALAPFAPPRSQPSLDRIAHLAGLSPAIAGNRPPASLPPPALRVAGWGAGGPAAMSVAPVVSVAVEIPISGYEGPVSRRAAAAFAAGATEVPASVPTAGASRTGLLAIVAAIAITTGLLLAGVAYFLLRDRADGGSIEAPETGPSVHAPITASHAPIADPGAASAAPAESGEPAATPEPSATTPEPSDPTPELPDSTPR